MRKICVCLVLCLLLGGLSARADFVLPQMLTVIEDEAFRGDTSLGDVTMLDGVTSIGAYACADCEKLNAVTIPASVTYIGPNAFDGCGDALLIRTEAGSFAAAYAQMSSFDYQAGTVYRALVIGQAYAGTDNALEGPPNDMEAVSACLGAMHTTSWIVSARGSLTASGILSAISSVFSGATENDVSLLYYSGHGTENGSLVGNDLYGLSPIALRNALDQVPGRKIVIVDACYSGKLITEDGETTVSVTPSDAMAGETDGSETDAGEPDDGEDEAQGVQQFLSAFQSAFRAKRRGALNTGSYYVITAARADQTSMEKEISSGGSKKVMGAFSFGFCLGCGFNGVTMSSVSLAADKNGDSAVSIQEAYAYADLRASSLSFYNQSAMVWPSRCIWFAPFRR